MLRKYFYFSFLLLLCCPAQRVALKDTTLGIHALIMVSLFANLWSGEGSGSLLTIDRGLRGAVGVGVCCWRSCRAPVSVDSRCGVAGCGGRLVLRGHGGLVGLDGDGEEEGGGQEADQGEAHLTVWK